MASNDDVNKSSKKSVNEIGQALKSFERELHFRPAGEIAALEKIEKDSRVVSNLYEQIKQLKAQIAEADRRTASASASLNSLQAKYSSTQDQQLRAQLAREYTPLRDELSAANITRERAQKQLEELEGPYAKGEERLNQRSESLEVRKAARQEAKEQHFTNRVKSIFSPEAFAGAVLREKRSPESIIGANKLIARGRTYDELYKRGTSFDKRIQEIQERAIEIGGTVFDLDNKPTNEHKEIQKLYGEFVSLQKAKAQNELALQARTAAGEDPASRESLIRKTSADILRRRGERELDKEIESGAVSLRYLDQNGSIRTRDVSTANITEEREKAESNFLEIQKQRDAATSAGVEELDKFTKALEIARESVEKLKEAEEKTGGGGGRHGMTGISNLFNAGALLGATGSAAYQILVGQTNTITSNRIASAQQANDLFFRRQAALSGDMTQLSLLSGGAPQAAEEEARKSKRNVNIALGASALGDAAIAGGAALATAHPAAKTLGRISQATGLNTGGFGSVSTAITTGLNATVSASDVLRQASANAEGRAEYARQMALQEEMAKVTGYQRQQFYNYAGGLRSAALQAGGGAGQFMNDMLGSGGDAMLERMKNAGISTEQMAQMSEMGFAQQGSVFDVNQVFAAKNLQNVGRGSVESNMRMMGQLAGAGANNPSASFEKVLEVAIARGFDSSKATSMLVENTAAMSQRSAAAAVGIDTAEAAASTIGAMAAGKDLVPNREMALSRAATAAEIYEGIKTNQGVSISTMATASLIQRAGGSSADYITAANIQKLDVASTKSFLNELQKYDTMSDKEKALFQERLSRKGMGRMINKENESLDKGALEEMLKTSLYAPVIGRMKLTGALDSSPESAAFIENLKKGPEGINNIMSTKEGRAKMRDADAAAYLTLGASMAELAGGMSTGRVAAGAAGDIISGKTGPQGPMKQLTELFDQPSKEMTNQAQLAATALGGVSEALGKITEMSKTVAQMGAEGKPGDFAESASKAAKEFNSGASQFKASVEGFDKALMKFAEKYSLPLDIRAPSNNDKDQKH